MDMERPATAPKLGTDRAEARSNPEPLEVLIIICSYFPHSCLPFKNIPSTKAVLLSGKVPFQC